jgi:hypothetical protein
MHRKILNVSPAKDPRPRDPRLPPLPPALAPDATAALTPPTTAALASSSTTTLEDSPSTLLHTTPDKQSVAPNEIEMLALPGAVNLANGKFTYAPVESNTLLAPIKLPPSAMASSGPKSLLKCERTVCFTATAPSDGFETPVAKRPTLEFSSSSAFVNPRNKSNTSTFNLPPDCKITPDQVTNICNEANQIVGPDNKITSGDLAYILNEAKSMVRDGLPPAQVSDIATSAAWTLAIKTPVQGFSPDEIAHILKMAQQIVGPANELTPAQVSDILAGAASIGGVDTFHKMKQAASDASSGVVETPYSIPGASEDQGGHLSEVPVLCKEDAIVYDDRMPVMDKVSLLCEEDATALFLPDKLVTEPVQEEVPVPLTQTVGPDEGSGSGAEDTQASEVEEEAI